MSPQPDQHVIKELAEALEGCDQQWLNAVLDEAAETRHDSELGKLLVAAARKNR